MKCVRLIHWDEGEGRRRVRQLAALGYESSFDAGDGAAQLRAVRGGDPPDAIVIDLTRLPSHGREAGRVLRAAKATRHVPLVFVGGDPPKVALTRALLPDATYATWGRLKAGLARAIAHPPLAPVVPGDLMSAKPTIEKLGVKAGYTVCLLGAPKGFAAALVPRPTNVTFTARPDRSCEVFLCFVRTSRELAAHVMTLRERIDRQTLWIIWPKKASGVKSDVDGNLVRETGLRSGWVDYKVCSVDSTWSGLAFKRRRHE